MSGIFARILGRETGQAAKTSGDQSPAVNHQGNGHVIIINNDNSGSDKGQSARLRTLLSLAFASVATLLVVFLWWPFPPPPPPPIVGIANNTVTTQGDQNTVVIAAGPVTINRVEDSALANKRQEELLAAIARDKGVPIAPLQAVLVRLGVLNVSPDQIPARLEAAAIRLLELEKILAQPIQGDPTAQAARDEARRLIGEGNFEAAATKLRQGRTELRKGREENQRIEATMAADEANIAKVALRYRTAAALYGEAADLVRFDPNLSWEYRLRQGNALFLRGDEFGDNEALLASITTFDQALSLAQRDRVPLDWAMTKNDLGNALQALGAREAGSARLEEAVTAYRAALEEYTRDRVPLYWAMTQSNLGAALFALGQREAGTARLEEAVTAFRAALEEWTRDRVPLNWAMTQNNLGGALQMLGAREAGTARLEEAVTAYRAALEERTRNRVPLDWAMTQNNLGAALYTLGQREAGTARLEEAVTAYRAALEERTRDRVSLDWAYSQHGLGNCLAELASHSATPEAHLAAAITHMENAVEGYRQVGDGYWGPIAEKRLAELQARQK